MEDTLIDVTAAQKVCLMSDERWRWYFSTGSSNATDTLLLAHDQDLGFLLRERNRVNFTPQQPDSSMPLLAFLASLSGSLGLLLGALAFAAISGWHLLRRRGKRYQRLHQAMSESRDHVGTLLPAYAMGAVQQSPAGVHLQLQRRARLESLLQTALGDQGKPLEFLPVRLAHQLGDGKQWIAGEEARPLFSPAGAWTESEARHASAGALGSRRWGLNSLSLQLTPGAIQVRASMLI